MLRVLNIFLEWLDLTLLLSFNSYHAVDLKVDVKVGRNSVYLDQVGKIQTPSHQGVVGRQHLCLYDMWTVADQYDEVMNCVVCNKKHVFSFKAILIIYQLY